MYFVQQHMLCAPTGTEKSPAGPCPQDTDRMLVHFSFFFFFFFFPPEQQWMSQTKNLLCVLHMLCSHYYHRHHYFNHCKSSLPALTHSFLHHSLFTVLAHKLLNKSDTQNFMGLLLLQEAFLLRGFSVWMFCTFLLINFDFLCLVIFVAPSDLFSTRCTNYWLDNYKLYGNK